MSQPENLSDLLEVVARAERVARENGMIVPEPVPAKCNECETVEIVDPEDRGRCRACAARHWRVQRAMRSVPEQYRWSSFDHPEFATRCPRAPLHADKIERAISDPEAKRVVFLGPSKAAKTTLAVAMLRRAAAETVRGGGRLGFVHAHRLARARAEHSLGDGEAPLVLWALNLDLALVDDLGNDRVTELSAVTDVIMDRHADSLATWFTTGLTPAEVRTRYGDGLARRIFERAIVIDLGAKA